jgi:hypothetical protein
MILNLNTSRSKSGEIHARLPWLAKPGRACFNHFIETGVLHEVGLRDTLEPDPDNTGVGSFRSRTAYFLDSQLSSLVS